MRRLSVPFLAAVALTACADDSPLASSNTPGQRPQLAVVTYGITTIGQHADYFSARALNDLGQLAVNEGFESNRAYMWVNGATTELRSDDGDYRPRAFDVNAQGVIVGELDAAIGTDDNGAAWVDGLVTRLSRPAGSAGDVRAIAVNDAGRIVGRRYTSDTTEGLVWSDRSDDSPTVLQTFGGSYALPTDINADGVIVGRSSTEDKKYRAAVWTSETAAPQPLKGFDGAPCESSAEPRAINDRGEIVGTCGRNDGVHAAFWADRDAVPVDLGKEYDFGMVRDLNELGQLIGQFWVENRIQPAIWSREGEGFRRFPLGIPEGLTRGYGAGLNNVGQAVGAADETGGSIGVLWKVPMRATLDLMPGTPSNGVKLDGRGTVAVAILGSRWFRAADVNAASLTLGNDDGLDTPIARKKGAPVARLTDVNGDNLPDLVAEFDEREMMANGDLTVGTTMLYLLGTTTNGTHLRGADVAQIAP